MTTVAVVIPCYREQLDRVRRTVKSALDTANVTTAIVVDDGCHDEALDTLSGDDVRVIHLPANGGCSVALNAGIRDLPEDSIICRLDVGDVFYPEAKARQIDVVLSGRARCSSSPHFDPVSGEPWTVSPNWQRAIYTDSVFTGCTNVYRKGVWREVGGHDESLRYLADWDFSMKVQYYVGWHMHDEMTCEAGMYPDGFSARAQLNPVTAKRRIDDRTVAYQRGAVFARPDAHKHLFDPKWCRKRGIEPLRRK
jgi:glycosyltransferase involved in cell wall biosynthesis